MKVTAWNSGKHLESGAGYGLKLNIEDRDTLKTFTMKYREHGMVP